MEATMGVSNFIGEMLPEFIISDERFWLVLVKTKQETAQFNLATIKKACSQIQKRIRPLH